MNISLAPFPIFLLWVPCRGSKAVWGSTGNAKESFQLPAGAAAQQTPRELDCRLHETVTNYPPDFISLPWLPPGGLGQIIHNFHYLKVSFSNEPEPLAHSSAGIILI